MHTTLAQAYFHQGEALIHARNLAVMGTAAAKVAHQVGGFLNKLVFALAILRSEKLGPDSTRDGSQWISSLEDTPLIVTGKQMTDPSLHPKARPVCLVEDDNLSAGMMGLYLRRRGHEVRRVGSADVLAGRAGIVSGEAVVVSPLEMPEETESLIASLRRQHPLVDILVVVDTARADQIRPQAGVRRMVCRPGSDSLDHLSDLLGEIEGSETLS